MTMNNFGGTVLLSRNPRRAGQHLGTPGSLQEDREGDRRQLPCGSWNKAVNGTALAESIRLSPAASNIISVAEAGKPTGPFCLTVLVLRQNALGRS